MSETKFDSNGLPVDMPKPGQPWTKADYDKLHEAVDRACALSATACARADVASKPTTAAGRADSAPRGFQRRCDGQELAPTNWDRYFGRRRDAGDDAPGAAVRASEVAMLQRNREAFRRPIAGSLRRDALGMPNGLQRSDVPRQPRQRGPGNFSGSNMRDYSAGGPQAVASAAYEPGTGKSTAEKDNVTTNLNKQLGSAGGGWDKDLAARDPALAS